MKWKKVVEQARTLNRLQRFIGRRQRLFSGVSNSISVYSPHIASDDVARCHLRLGGPQTWYGPCGEEINVRSLPEMEPRFFGYTSGSPVTMPTELQRHAQNAFAVNKFLFNISDTAEPCKFSEILQIPFRKIVCTQRHVGQKQRSRLKFQ